GRFGLPYFGKPTATDLLDELVVASPDAEELARRKWVHACWRLVGRHRHVRQRLLVDQALKLWKLSAKPAFVTVQRRLVAVQVADAIFLVNQSRGQTGCVSQLRKLLQIRFDSDHLIAPPPCFQVSLDQLVERNLAERIVNRRQKRGQINGIAFLPCRLEPTGQILELAPVLGVEPAEIVQAFHVRFPVAERSRTGPSGIFRLGMTRKMGRSMRTPPR